jgi:glutamine---fructose-6-phosphate transaminase (isomerizing)
MGRAVPEQRADHHARTCENETAGTFSVSYLASLAVLARMAGVPSKQIPERPFSKAHVQLPDAISQALSVSSACDRPCESPLVVAKL